MYIKRWVFSSVIFKSRNVTGISIGLNGELLEEMESFKFPALARGEDWRRGKGVSVECSSSETI